MAASNQVSTVVAATGFAVLAPTTPPASTDGPLPGDPDSVTDDDGSGDSDGASTGDHIHERQEWFHQIDFARIWELRKVTSDGTGERKIIESLAFKEKLQRALFDIFLMTERRFDKALWKTLEEVIFNGAGGGEKGLLNMAETFGDLPTNANIRSYSKALHESGMPPQIIKLWEQAA